MGQVLIDGQLVFDEDSFLLYRVDATDEEPLRLGAIASRCLGMLLRSGGTVVRKRELMVWAWGQYDLEVTDNSLAQVIRQLRLALEKLWPDREFIQTLPRIGYKLADSVRIEEISTVAKGAPVVSAPVSDNEGSTLAASTPTTIDIGSDEMQSPSITTTQVLAETTAGLLPVTPAKQWGLWIALLLWGSFTFLLGLFWMTPPTDVSPPMFAAPVTINEVHVHPPIESQSMEPSFVQTLVQNSRKLAGLLGMSSNNLHLYLLEGHRRADQILCDGELEAASSRCIGVQEND